MAISTYNPIAAAYPATPTKTIADAACIPRSGARDSAETNRSQRAGRGIQRHQVQPARLRGLRHPNLDVAYLEAWIATDDDAAVLLEVPEITGRYYTAQILDEWGEVIVNINERQMASRPFGTFALTKPGTSPQYPREATRLDLHSSKAKLLARVELKDDHEGALALQHRFILTPFGLPAIDPPPRVPAFGNQGLIGVEIFDDADERLSSALDVSPVAAAMQQKVRAVAEFAASSADARASIDELLRNTVIPELIQSAATKSATSRNNWNGGPSDIGRYRRNYRLRTVVNPSASGQIRRTGDLFIASRDTDGRRSTAARAMSSTFRRISFRTRSRTRTGQ
jgi:hypothetical protein